MIVRTYYLSMQSIACIITDENSVASSQIICLGGPNKCITLYINASATICAVQSLSGTAIIKLVWSQVITNNRWHPPKACGMVLISINRSCIGA